MEFSEKLNERDTNNSRTKRKQIERIPRRILRNLTASWNILEEENCVEEEDKRDFIILQSEIDFATENLKNKRACGIDE